jgi:hypothetical protein
MWEKRNPKKYGVSSLSFHGMPILWEMGKTSETYSTFLG